MNTQSSGGMRTRAFLLVTACAAALLSAGVASASNGNQAAASACLGGGFAQLARQDGSSFARAGDCISYAARGGAFAAPCAAPAVGQGPLSGGASPGAGRFDVLGSGFATWAAYDYVELTLDDCEKVRFYNFETSGQLPPGGEFGQLCPFGTRWTDTEIRIACVSVAGRAVTAIAIYGTAGDPLGYLDIPDVAVESVPSFTFGAVEKPTSTTLAIPVSSANADLITVARIFFEPVMPGYGVCGSGNEFSSAYFNPTDPLSVFVPPWAIVSWTSSAIVLDVGGPQDAYPGGFKLCGVALAYGPDHVGVGKAFPAGDIFFGN